jgi:dTDP-4-dehydrorhamnose 3,5-epimerase-like enzyme
LTTVESRCRLVPLGRFDEERGSLCVAEASRHVPFQIKRIYWVFSVPQDRERGHHAHREQHELMVAVRGAFTVHTDDGQVRITHRLDCSDRGLLVPKMVWHHLSGFSEDAVCLVLASGPYDEAEYVRDYKEFRELVASR